MSNTQVVNSLDEDKLNAFTCKITALDVTEEALSAAQETRGIDKGQAAEVQSKVDLLFGGFNNAGEGL